MGAHISTRTEIDAPAERVWDILMGFDHYPRWNPFLTAVRLERSFPPLPGDTVHFDMRLPGASDVIDIDPEILRVHEHSELLWRGRFLCSSCFGGDHYFVLERLPGDRCALHHGETFTGCLWHCCPCIIEPCLVSRLRRGFLDLNAALKRRAESGKGSEWVVSTQPSSVGTSVGSRGGIPALVQAQSHAQPIADDDGDRSQRSGPLADSSGNIYSDDERDSFLDSAAVRGHAYGTFGGGLAPPGGGSFARSV